MHGRACLGDPDETRWPAVGGGSRRNFHRPGRGREELFGLWGKEVREIFIGPGGDAKCYFEFEVNPLNTALDLVLRKNQSGWRKDFSWDCDGFRSAVQRVETGWNAEIAIPFGSIAAGPPMVGAEWRVN